LSSKLSRSHAPLRIEIRPSNFILIANTALALSALAAIAQTSLPFSLQLVACAIALVYAARQLRLHIRQRGLLLWQEGWQWVELNREPRLLELRRAVIWPGLIVLRFDEATLNRRLVLWYRNFKDSNLTLTLCRDSLDADEARRLRAYLRHWPVLAE
jgi:hypothetical protein